MKTSSTLRTSRALVILALILPLAISGFLTHSAQAVNSELDVTVGKTDLLNSGSYDQATTPTTTSDVTFKAVSYSGSAGFTISGNNSLSIGTVNDLGTPTLTISNGTGLTTSTLTFNGGGDTVAGSNAADLLYVAPGSSLTIQNGTGTLNVTLAASGNLDVVGNSSISSVIAMGANAITKTGSGTLTINGGNSGTGGFTIAAGTVSTSNNSGLGTAGGVFIGSGSENATLQFTGSPSGFGQNITVAAGAGTRSIITTNSTAYPSNGVVDSNSITINHDLIVADTSSGNIQFRGNITGSFAVTADLTNVGVIDLRGANTFSSLAINGGAVVANTTTNTALGTGTVTLGLSGNATAAILGTNNSGAQSNAITVTSGGARTIQMYSASSTAGVFSGPIALSNDLTLTAIATTAITGGDRLRIGSGGVTGSNNIIINNLNNTLTGAQANSGAIRLDGSGSATAWIGNLIVGAGQGGLGTSTATGTSNTVGVASGALFNFSSGGSFTPTIAGLANASSTALGGSTGGTVYSSQNSAQTLNLGGSGTYTFAGVIADGSTVISGATGTTALTVALTGAGSQTLSGNNTYTGTTTVSSGTLLVNGSHTTTTGTGFYTVASGATLGGTGTIATATAASGGVQVSIHGTLNPGNGGSNTGTLTLNGVNAARNMLGIETDGTLALDINVGVRDMLNITNAAASDVRFISGTSTISFNDLSLGGLVLGSYKIISTDLGNNSVFQFGATTLVGSGPQTIWASDGSVTGNVTVTGLAAYGTNASIYASAGDMYLQIVPEPGTWAMLLGGMGMLVLFRRRRA